MASIKDTHNLVLSLGYLTHHLAGNDICTLQGNIGLSQHGSPGLGMRPLSTHHQIIIRNSSVPVNHMKEGRILFSYYSPPHWSVSHRFRSCFHHSWHWNFCIGARLDPNIHPLLYSPLLVLKLKIEAVIW